MRLAAIAMTGVLLGTGPALALDPAVLEAAAAEATDGLRTVVKRLTAHRMGGRDNGTPESRRAQSELIRRLRRMADGIHGGRSFDAYLQPFVQAGQAGANVLAIVHGRERPDEYVIAGGHYDHLDSRSNAGGDCSARGAPGGELCPGATDNAAGVAVVMAIAKALRGLPEPPRRSIVLALWDAEEDGLQGSRFYVEHPLVPLEQTMAYVNFDIQGSNLLPSLSATSFSVGAETGGSALGAFVDEAVAAERFGTLPVSYVFGQGRSDYANFVDIGHVPTVFFGDSTGPCYHTVGDTYARVDFKKLRAQSRIGFRVVTALAEAAGRPPFRGPNPLLASFTDALSIEAVFRRAEPDIPVLFPPPDQVILRGIQTDLAAVVGAGPGAFDGAAVATVLGAALQGIGAIGRLPCGAF
jgi:hypothetical protein